ncbi:enolase C-terminal domain-like protein [Timonella senegalensis]|uniref:enolase C-terminal domain-like protein n=1 Tax=Timonella senegalensis TaxID=1465825 RepID=UPI0028B092E9|nr:enolase C-terminal domain-like protein [Timonella senegalensis]
MNTTIITDIKTFVTAPRNLNLVVVRIETNQPGLVGHGCATFTWRHEAVVTAIDKYLRPMMVGRQVNAVEDAWQTMMGSSYWRNSAVLNNAISGVDEALWDIKGKAAGMPLYELFGGKSREGALVYQHADGRTYEEVAAMVQGYLDSGTRHIRCQMGTYGGNANGKMQSIAKPEGAPHGAYFSPRDYMRSTVELFSRLRADFGYEVEFMHDIHERLPLVQALELAKDLEPYKLFFLEDALPPDQVQYFKNLREQTSVPFAMGELFTHPLEWRSIIQNQWIDFIRVHISDIGGVTPARKLAALCEAYGVRTAWHGPNDLSPIGAAAQIHLDLNSPNFGIQEFAGFTEEERAIFPGCPELRNGYLYLNEQPGIGVGFDETEAAKFPAVELDTSWLFARLPDGTAARP